MRTDRDGRGIVNILAADKLMNNPRLYATFLLWLHVGAVRGAAGGRRSRQAEAGVLLRRGASPVQRRAARRWSRRSSGWCASSARRASASISSRRTRSTCRRRCWRSSATACSTRCAPSRRATRRRCASAAETFRQNPAFDTEKAITELGVGEALVSTLEGKGAPSMVERTLIAPPMGAGRPDRRRRAPADHRGEPAAGQVRHSRSTGIGLRDAGQARREGGRRCAGRGSGAGGILDMIGGDLRHRPAAQGPKTGRRQRVAREVTRTVVNQTVGGLAAETRQVASAAARAARSAAPSCAGPWAAC